MATDTMDQPKEKQKRSFVERLADKLGINANARSVYSDPIECDGTTIVPVAKVRWGFGGGEGKKGGKRGKGGGGGVQVFPLGYIEMKDGETRYKPIHDPASLVPLVVVGGLSGWLVLRALRKLFRR